MTTPSEQIAILIGRKAYPVASYAEASRLFCLARDRMGEGASKTPTPLLIDGSGNTVGYVSYNGRVWRGSPTDWTVDSVPVFSPF